MRKFGSPSDPRLNYTAGEQSSGKHFRQDVCCSQSLQSPEVKGGCAMTGGITPSSVLGTFSAAVTGSFSDPLRGPAASTTSRRPWVFSCATSRCAEKYTEARTSRAQIHSPLPYLPMNSA